MIQAIRKICNSGEDGIIFTYLRATLKQESGGWFEVGRKACDCQIPTDSISRRYDPFCIR